MHIIRIEARGGIGNADAVHVEPVASPSACFHYSRLEPSSFPCIHRPHRFLPLIHLSAREIQSHLLATRRPKTEAYSAIRNLRAIRHFMGHLMGSCQHVFPLFTCSTFCAASTASAAAWFH